jgi:hypothetical protein
MEALVEIILVAAGVIMALGLLPFGAEVRFLLRLSGLVLAASGVAVFALVAFPQETLVLLGACAGIAGAGWGYAQITRGLADRGIRRWTARIRRGSQANADPAASVPARTFGVTGRGPLGRPSGPPLREARPGDSDFDQDGWSSTPPLDAPARPGRHSVRWRRFAFGITEPCSCPAKSRTSQPNIPFRRLSRLPSRYVVDRCSRLLFFGSPRRPW